MIYCVIPPSSNPSCCREWSSTTATIPNVEVIVDRRARAGDRRAEGAGGPDERRELRDRRRPRAMGTFPPTDAFDPEA